jgi:prepilin-type N-terminal cleavage/methylation domain-containing protein
VFYRTSLQHRRNAGFTLIEAMIVVAIIGISAALAAPALGTAIADRRAGEATHSLVRVGARARSEAMVLGRAHVLAFETEGNGRVSLWRGRSNLCNQNDWPSIIAGACNDSIHCLETLDMASYDHGHHQVRMRIVAAPAFMCFQPDGDVLFSDGPTDRFNPLASAAEGVRFTIERLAGGSVDGVRREVVFPIGGSPRIVR